MKRRDNKGFTLIELLGAITILGIVSLLAIVSVTRLIDNSKKKQRDGQEKTISMAAESYMQSNRSMLPKSIGEKTTIKVKTLKDSNYLKEDVVDASGQTCMNESYVVVYKQSTTKYTYKTYLYCGKEKPKDDEKLVNPTIDVDFIKEDGSIITKEDAVDLSKVSNPQYKIVITGGEKGGKKYALEGYSFSISVTLPKDGGGYEDREVYSSGSLSANGAKKVVIPGENSASNVTGSLKDYIDITRATNVTIYVSARNSEGVAYEKATSLTGELTTPGKDITYHDTEKPTCSKPANNGEAANENDWINKSNYSSVPRKITVSCNDNGGSGCVRKKYTKTWPNSDEWSYIIVKDNAGNTSDQERTCRVRVNVDIDSPVIEIDAFNSKNSNASVFTSDVVKTSKNVKTDSVSVGSNKYKNLVNGWMNSSNYGEGVFYKVTITDNLYLKSYKWEVNKEGLSSAGNDLSVSNASDGIAEKTITDGNAECNTKKCTFYVSFNKDGKRKGRLTVKDRAGNKVVYIIEANLDRTSPGAPRVTYKTNNKNYTPGNWTGSNVVAHAKTTTKDLSGFDKFQYQYILANNTKVEKTFAADDSDIATMGDSGKNKFKCLVWDKAGNTSAWSNVNGDAIWIDKIAPTNPTIAGFSN